LLLPPLLLPPTAVAVTVIVFVVIVVVVVIVIVVVVLVDNCKYETIGLLCEGLQADEYLVRKPLSLTPQP
jgi:hypothetical protein